MNLYNSLTNEPQEVKPIIDKLVKIYSCGPTVYDDVHIGNLSSFIYADSLARVIRLDHEVKHVMNITDVDDKTINRSQELYPDLEPKQALSKLTKVYEEKFKSDISRLNINPGNYTFINATASIEIMQNLIVKLLDNKFAYLSDDGIYFSISKYRASGKKYGKLIKLDQLEEDTMQSRIDNDEYDKQTIHDFALWKFKKDNEPSWEFIIEGQDYPGRPGWHIECSAMSTSLLGQPFDIHTGGVDLKFPHHENEIAQSTSIHSEEYLAKIFFHNEHLLNNNQKMSKSLNNFLTLDDITRHIDDAVAFRLLVLQSNYKNQSEFSIDNLKAANNRLNSYKNFAVLRYQLDKDNQFKELNFNKITDEIISSMKNDLDSPKALSDLSVFINSTDNSLINNNQSEELNNFLKLIDEIFGFGLLNIKDLWELQKSKLDKRLEKRQKKDWTASDSIRDELFSEGIGIIDTDKQQIWFRL